VDHSWQSSWGWCADSTLYAPSFVVLSSTNEISFHSCCCWTEELSCLHLTVLSFIIAEQEILLKLFRIWLRLRICKNETYWKTNAPITTVFSAVPMQLQFWDQGRILGHKFGCWPKLMDHPWSWRYVPLKFKNCSYMVGDLLASKYSKTMLVL
jgi:hypothetical protein